MREIKFRTAFYKDDETFSHFKYWGIDYPSKGLNTYPSKCNFAIAKVHDQFTGMKDKNGIDIYEGDITEAGVVGWNVVNAHWEYQYQDGISKMFPLADIEVIGNIHDNPEEL